MAITHPLGLKRFCSTVLVALSLGTAFGFAPSVTTAASASTNTVPTVVVDSTGTTTAPVTGSFRGLRADEEPAHGLQNPDGGLREEISYNAADLSSPWDSAQPTDIRQALPILENRYGAPGDTRETQLYFYLWDFARPSCTPIPLIKSCPTTPLDISQTALNNIALTLGRLRDIGYKAVLRFAYDDGVRADRCYDVSQIQRAITQLKPVLAQYSDVITVWQAGFIGDWGEWGPNCNSLQNNATYVNTIMNSLVAALPAGVHANMRYAWHRNELTTASTKDQVGYHNDFFTLGGGAYDYYTPSAAEWSSILAAAPYVMTDGEMPWDKNQSSDPNAWSTVIDPVGSARRLQTIHFSTFSVTHNATVTYPSWRQTAWNKSTVVGANLPVDDGYFENTAGAPVTRTAYEYIRDHLGYRLQLSGATFGVEQGGVLPVSFSLSNTGFSAPHNARSVQLVVLDSTGQAVRTVTTGADWTTWQGAAASENGGNGSLPTYTVNGSLDLNGLPAGSYRIGVALPASGATAGNTAYAVRFANSGVDWVSGANVIGNLTVS